MSCTACGKVISEHAKPLHSGAQSSLLYYSQLLYYQVYQLRRNEQRIDYQKSLNMGLIRSGVEILEGALDQVFIMQFQLSSMVESHCKTCYISEVNRLGSISSWEDYKKTFDKLFPKHQLDSIFSNDDLEAVCMVFRLRNLISHCQPLRSSLIPTSRSTSKLGDPLGKQHKKLSDYLKKKKLITPSDEPNAWTWDVLISDKVLAWAIEVVRSFIAKLKEQGSFPLFQYVEQLKVTMP